MSVVVNGRWPLNLPPFREEFHTENPAWEAEHLDSMHAHLRTGDVLYDIGAEQGDLPALYASWGCDVVCIEPAAHYWPNIRACFELNGTMPRAMFHGFCDADAPAWPTRLHRWPTASEGPLFLDHGFCHLDERPEISRITVDDLTRIAGAPAALTIDVEGAEYRVLFGGRQTLAEHKPLLWVSVHQDMDWMQLRYPGQGVDAIRALLHGYGYTGDLLGTDHEAHWFFRPS